MSSFKSFTTNRSWKLGYRGALWQARFYDHIVRKSEGGQRIAEYIVHNPVRKGLVVEAGCINTAGPRTRCSERAWMAMGYVSAHERAGDGATSLLSLRFVAWQRRDVMETDGRLFLGPSASGVEQATKQPVNHFWRYTRARGHTRQAGSSLV